MSIQDSGSGGVSYSDHDVHHVRHQAQVIPGSGGDDVTVNDVRQFEITERGLDPDELAELRAMRVSVGAIVGASQGQSSRGEVSFSVGCGFNLTGNEFLTLTDDDASETFDPDGDATDEVRIITGDTDEVGQLYHLTDNVNIGYDDDTNGNGAGGANNSTTEMLNMADLFGSGPYVDAADDFSTFIGFNPDNVIESVNVVTKYSLYYNVTEVEGGRTRFGR